MLHHRLRAAAGNQAAEAPEVPTANLAHRWRASSIADGAMTDLAGSRPLTLFGGPATETDGGREVIHMDGVDDYARSSGAGPLSGHFTIVLRVKVPGAALGGENLRAMLIQGKDSFGSGWGLRLALTATGISGDIVTASPLAARVIPPHTYPVSKADTWVVAWFRFSPGKFAFGYDDTTEVSATTFSATGIRSSTYGMAIADQNVSSSVSPVRAYYEEVLVYNTNITDAALGQAIAALS